MRLLLAGLIVLVLLAWHDGPGQPVPWARQPRADGAECLLEPHRGGSAQNPLYVDEAGTLVFTLFHGGYNRGPAGLFRRPARGGDEALLDEGDADSVNMPGSAICWPRGRSHGGLLVFASDRVEREELWTLDLATLRASRVSHHHDASAWREPTWSPDGRWVVFERNDREARGSIWKMRVDGNGLTRLSPPPRAGFDDRQPNWSPRGGAIVFQRRRAQGGPWHLWLMDERGEESRPLTHGRGEETDAAWSPDGQGVVFSASREGTDEASIHVVEASGQARSRLTRPRSAQDAAPCWSLDGSWVAFESRRLGEPGASLWRIRVAPR